MTQDLYHIKAIELLDYGLLLTTDENIHPQKNSRRRVVKKLWVIFPDGDGIIYIEARSQTGEACALFYRGNFLIFKDGAIA